MEQMENYRNSSSKFWLWIVIALVSVFVVFLGLWYQMVNWYDIPKTANEFGDSFGMANALFSALAFAFLIVTAIMQRKELELQRQELHDTRAELAKSAVAQKQSQQALTLQARILAKQALLKSYQSRYDANLKLSRDGVNTNSEQRRNIGIRYLKLVELAAIELEKEHELFTDKTLAKQINLIKKTDYEGSTFLF